jgi:hypothetical protein
MNNVVILIENIKKLHNKIISSYEYDEINSVKRKTLFDINVFNPNEFIKQSYKYTFCLISNILNVFVIGNNSDDKKYINKILELEDLDMNEVRKKTDDVCTGENTHLYSGIVKWIGGNTWSNALITNGFEEKLDAHDKEIISSINKAVELVEPIERPLTLFHGFEKFSNYKENEFEIGKTFIFPGILSKTSCFRIAQNFALFENYLQPKYLIVLYPAKSKHIGLDIKPEKYDEYEYINKSGEKLKLIKICRIFDNFFRLQTFYICESQDY